MVPLRLLAPELLGDLRKFGANFCTELIKDNATISFDPIL